MTHVVERHVTVHARVFGPLVRHDAPGGVEDQDIDPIRLRADLLRRLRHRFPVGHVALQPGDLIGGGLAQLLPDVGDGAVHGLLGHGEDEESG